MTEPDPTLSAFGTAVADVGSLACCVAAVSALMGEPALAGITGFLYLVAVALSLMVDTVTRRSTGLVGVAAAGVYATVWIGVLMSVASHA